MLLSADPVLEEAQALLGRHGFERILEVPSVPLRNPHGIRYGRLVRTGHDEQWYLRSAEPDFMIVARSWTRQGMRRCYSLGWGLAADRQTDRLLLAQGMFPDRAEADRVDRAVAAELTGLAVTPVGRSVSELWGEACLRVVATLRLRFDAAGELESPAGRGKLFTLGPRWRNITAVWASGDEKLLRVELPVAFRVEVAEHVTHPAMLDTVAAAVRGPGQASSVPFHYGHIVVHAPRPATFHAHVRRAPGAEPRRSPETSTSSGTTAPCWCASSDSPC